MKKYQLKNSFKVIIALLMSIIMTSLHAQEVLHLKKGEAPGKGSLSQMKWLEGYWTGTGFRGDCDEIWLPPVDNSMHGIFRYVKNDTLNFTEYIVIEQVEESLVIKLKHFSRDLSPWEEKNQWTEFKLVKIEGQTAYFSGLTYHVEKKRLIIKLALKSGEKSRIEEFVFTKKKI